MKILAIMCAATMMTIAGPASAVVTFDLSDVTLAGGATLTGSFTTSDDLRTLLGLDFTTSAGDFNGRHFDATSYALSDVSYLQLSANSAVRLDKGGNELQLAFTGFTAAGAALAANSSSEHSQIAGNRAVIGGSIIAAQLDDAGAGSDVPEPAIWVTMTLGFGLAGMAMRRRAKADMLYV